MKIAVCVKQVPDAAVHKRIDPATKRLDRSGEAALNPVDANAVEEALRIKDVDRRRRGRGRLARAREGAWTRCARRSRWAPTVPCSSPTTAAAGSDLVATSYALAQRARARGRRPRPLRPAGLRLRRRRALGRRRRAAPAADDLAGGGADARERLGHRQAPDRVRLRRHSRRAARRRRGRRLDQRAALPVAQGDHGREEEAAGRALPRRARRRGRPRRRGRARAPRCSRSRSRRRGATRGRSRTTGPARSRSSPSWRRSGSYDDPRLPRASRRRAAEGLARRPLEGRGPRAATSPPSILGSGVEGLAADAGRYGAATVYVADDPKLEAPLPQPRVDALAQLVRDKGYRDRALRAVDPLGRHRRRRSRRGSTPGSTGSSSTSAEQDGQLVGKQTGARRLRARRRGLALDTAARALPRRRLRSGRDRRRGQRREARGRASRSTRCSPRWSSRRTRSRPARRSRTRT